MVKTEHCVKQQNEVEILTAQLSEKDSNLQKCQEEWDQLIAALKIQLKGLISSNVQKNNEMNNLKRSHQRLLKQKKKTLVIKPSHRSSMDLIRFETEPQTTSFEISRNE